ncbi:MAG: 3'-5' exonuclease, partial [Bacteroidetes bacterium]
AGIYSEFGKIICISVGYISDIKTKTFRVKSFYGDNETQLISDFFELLNKSYNKHKNYLCAHNGLEFDFPFIARRAVINNIKLSPMLDISATKRWENKHLIDTMEMWKFGDYKHYTSLDLLVHLFNIPTPKNDIDGSQVADVYYKEKNLERIVKYCEKDVIAIARLYLRFNNLEIIPDENIVYL